MTLQVREGGLDAPEVRDLLTLHLQGMAEHSPPESIHALPLDELARPGISFWSAWFDGRLAGCGALKTLDERHGEIKAMRTAQAFLRQGVGAAILREIIEVARHRGFERLSLETGSAEAFRPAQLLYLKYGFAYCEPFGDYRPDPFSVFMDLPLDSSVASPDGGIKE